MPLPTGFLLDTRSGLGFTKSVQIQNDQTRQVGVNSSRVPRFVYFAKTPSLVERITYTVLATLATWQQAIDDMETAYNAIETVPQGLFVESLTPGQGWFVIDNEVYYAGTYVEADYLDNAITAPPLEFQIVDTENINTQGIAGYLEDGTPFFNSNVFATTRNRSLATSLTNANNNYLLYQDHPTDSNYFLTSKNLTNLREISSTLYVDLNLTYTQKKATTFTV